MEAPCAAWFMAVLGFAAVVSSSEAYVFYAGGRDGWVVDPSESFNHWAERNRFQVNDTIVFMHDDEVAGSVLLVTEQDFDACNTGNPVQRLDDVAAGRSVFRFDRSGPFFFISGDEDRCQKGQKLYIIVMAVRQMPPSEAPEPAAAGPGSSESSAGPAFPPTGDAMPPSPFWASPPEYAQAPGRSSLDDFDGEMSRSSTLGAPPPMSGAAGLDEVVAGLHHFNRNPIRANSISGPNRSHVPVERGPSVAVIYMDKETTSDLVLDNGNFGRNAGSAQEPLTAKGKTSGVRNRYKQTDKGGRKGTQISPSKKYALRSSHSSVRVLRSASKKKNETPKAPVNDNTAVQQAAKKRKRNKPLKPVHSSLKVLPSASKRKTKARNELVNEDVGVQLAVKKRKVGRPPKGETPKDDYLTIRKRVRYILNRMNYEQSLIQAYASEGWKGQSLEKIRPEKELERAKVEILRCKLRIREAFQNLDSLLSEGKLEESLFDSAGEIDSEDIFCAICGSKDVTLKNDIILCDGICDRGFHQFCINPPLFAEDIPPGDEGWLCPACDCKIDCIDVLNELQEVKLSIHDSWEKVFPEAASFANGSKQINASDLPSDDSADNDYNPALTQGHSVDEEKSSGQDEGEKLDSDDSSEDSESYENEKSKTSKNGRTVDDLGLPSEDSEDDDFDPEGPDSDKDQNDDPNSDQSDESDFTSDSDDFCGEIAKSCVQDEISGPSSSQIRTVNHANESAFDSEPNAENLNLAFMETELEQDMVLPVSSKRQVEAFGKASSDSSDEEEWSGNISEQQTEVLCSNSNGSTSRKRHFGPTINQKLKVYFKEDPYPSRAIKENLAQELGLTFNQVSKWFSSTRHYSRVAATKKENNLENHTAEHNNSNTVDTTELRGSNEMMMGKVSVHRNDTVERTGQNNLNESIPLRQDTSCGQGVVVTPTGVNQNCHIVSKEIGSPKCGTRENQGNDSTSNIGTPKVKSAEKTSPGVEHADEARRKAIQRELRKMKTGK
uniref:Homeobox domain-containing protein n=1 Tax=Leersia perrieri TaxID=77586 RepID=A0A0D9V5L4_9ORYZ